MASPSYSTSSSYPSSFSISISPLSSSVSCISPKDIGGSLGQQTHRLLGKKLIRMPSDRARSAKSKQSATCLGKSSSAAATPRTGFIALRTGPGQWGLDTDWQKLRGRPSNTLPRAPLSLTTASPGPANDRSCPTRPASARQLGWRQEVMSLRSVNSAM